MNRAAAIFAGIALLAGTPAVAAPTDKSDALALEALHNFAICAVKRTPDGAVQLLTLEPGTPEYAKASRAYAKGHDYCAPHSRLEFASVLFAGDLAEALIAQSYPAGALTAAASGPARRSLTKLDAIGQCVTRAKPDAVAALFATDPGSEAELGAITPTGEVLPDCIPQGQTLKMNRSAVRAIYALGAYRLLAGEPEPDGQSPTTSPTGPT